jgi:hypothetical protein
MMVFIFLYFSQDTLTLSEILDKHVSIGDSLSKTDQETPSALITAEKQDPNYNLTQGEVF